MPVQCDIQIRDVSDEEFRQIDYAVMGEAFDVQNQLGRLCPELAYEVELARRLKAAGRKVATQVLVEVVHSEFVKEYWLDLVVDGFIYELKAIEAISTAHEAQAINYAALLGCTRVKILNFGAPKVGGRLIRRTQCQEADSSEFCDSAWQPISDSCRKLRLEFERFVSDIGSGCSTELYREFLIQLCGGPHLCLQSLPLELNSCRLGNESFTCHTPQGAFIVTGLTGSRDQYRLHVSRLLNLSPLSAIQWFNINGNEVTVETIQSESPSFHVQHSHAKTFQQQT